MKWKVERKRAVITGAAVGIGRALAIALAERSVHLCLVDQDAERLAATATACRQFPILVEECVVDLTARDAPEQIRQHLLTTMGGVDILINNAGIGYYGPFEPMSDEQITLLLNVNLTSVLRLTNVLLPLLLQHERAHVLNIGSIYALFQTRRSAAYHASKYGLLGFSLALRAEYARYGLGVSCLCPGFVDTELFERMLTPEGTERRTPPTWLLTPPEKVAKAAVRAILKNQRIATVNWSEWALHHFSWMITPVLDLTLRFQRHRRHSFGREYLENGPMPLADIVKREGFPASGQSAEVINGREIQTDINSTEEESTGITTGDETADGRPLPRG